MAPTFLFDSLAISTVTASSDYYIRMVSAVPPNSAVTIGDITGLLESTGQLLTGCTFVSKTLSFTNQIFASRTYTVPTVGYVLALRSGGSFSNSDLLICYSPHTNAFGQEIIFGVGTYAIGLRFSAGGLFSVADAWQYSIGAFIPNGGQVWSNGLLQLMGTRNNTVAFSNPLNNAGAGPINYIGSSGSSSYLNMGTRTANTTALNSLNSSVMLNFKDGDVKFNSGAFFSLNGYNDNTRLKLYATNYLAQGWTSAALLDPANWTLLTTYTNPYNPASLFDFSPTFSTSSYFKYLKLELEKVNPAGVFAGVFGNIDFFKCTIRTPFENFV
jgi:hypothetical protein